MKRKYMTPELSLVQLELKDVILGSPEEETIGENIGGGGGGGGSFDDLDGGLL